MRVATFRSADTQTSQELAGLGAIVEANDDPGAPVLGRPDVFNSLNARHIVAVLAPLPQPDGSTARVLDVLDRCVLDLGLPMPEGAIVVYATVYRSACAGHGNMLHVMGDDELKLGTTPDDTYCPPAEFGSLHLKVVDQLEQRARPREPSPTNFTGQRAPPRRCPSLDRTSLGATVSARRPRTFFSCIRAPH